MAAAPDPKKTIGVGESRVQRGRLSRGTRLTRMYLEVKGGTWETDQDSVSALQRVRQKEKCESLASDISFTRGSLYRAILNMLEKFPKSWLYSGGKSFGTEETVLFLGAVWAASLL